LRTPFTLSQLNVLFSKFSSEKYYSNFSSYNQANADRVKFKKEVKEIANISKLFGFWATMGGLGLGGLLLAKVSLFRALLISFVVQIGSTTMFVIQAHVGHNLELLAATIAAENLASGMGTAVFIAYLSNLCNIKYTATQYALFSSLFAISRTLLSTGSGALAEQFGWAFFFILTMIAATPGLILLFMMRYYDAREDERKVFT